MDAIALLDDIPRTVLLYLVPGPNSWNHHLHSTVLLVGKPRGPLRLLRLLIAN
jgi:hypothetical protein